MRRRPVAVLVAAALLVVATGCGGRLASLADDVGRAAGSSGDEVLRTAEQEAAGSGQSVDDLVARWRAAVVDGGTTAASRYSAVPQEIRSVACSTVTDVLADALDGDARTDPAPLEALVTALGGLNATVGARALATDVGDAATNLRAGRPATLALLTIKAGTCHVLG